MSQPGKDEVTAVLRELAQGIPGASDRLMSMVYDELRAMARGRLRSEGRFRSDATTLVHEAYLRLFQHADQNWENRRHFFWAASKAMQGILVDRARARCRIKRGGGAVPVPLDPAHAAQSESEGFLHLNEAIEKLQRENPDIARIVMLRYYAGLSRDEVAEVLGISSTAVWRDWEYAKAWLIAELGDSVAVLTKHLD